MVNNPADGSILGKIAGYLEILNKDPRSTVFVPLAEAYRRMGLLDDALDVATRGVRALPTFSPGYAILGRIQTQRGALDGASAAFEKALLIERENLSALKGLARVRMLQGDRGRALELVQRAVALTPDDAVAQQMLAALRSLPAGRPLAAAPVKQDMPEMSAAPTPEPELESEVMTVSPRSPDEPISTPTIAEIYIRQGFLQRAVKVYRDLLEADPHNEEIRQKLVALKMQIETGQVPPKGEGRELTTAAATTVAADLPPEVPAPAGIPSVTATLDILTRWLDSSRRRRADVR